MHISLVGNSICIPVYLFWFMIRGLFLIQHLQGEGSHSLELREFLLLETWNCQYNLGFRKGIPQGWSVSYFIGWTQKTAFELILVFFIDSVLWGQRGNLLVHTPKGLSSAPPQFFSSIKFKLPLPSCWFRIQSQVRYLSCKGISVSGGSSPIWTCNLLYKGCSLNGYEYGSFYLFFPGNP